MTRLLRALPLLALATVACSEDDARVEARPDGGAETPDAGLPEAPRDWPGMTAPSSSSEAGVRREIFLVDGATPPANPTSGTQTPAALNATRVVRYRRDTEPSQPPQAIMLAYPGFLSGAGPWDTLARALVLRGVDAGFPLEVWAIDRRANLLEDLRGVDTAEMAGQPEIAQGYYFGEDTIDGEAFAGFHTQAQLDYMSEWGLAVHVEDLRRVIALIPEAQRKRHLFLAGHSLGASFTEAFASWRFEDGVRGHDMLAGLLLIDGALGDAPTDEDTWRNGGMGTITGSPGITALRAGQPYSELPFLGVSVYALSEVQSLWARHDPTGLLVPSPGLTQSLRLLLSVPRLPPMTNRAALGFAFDDQFNPLAFVVMSLGQATGGAIERYANPLAMGAEYQRPSDFEATYDWVDAPDADPAELTPLDSLIRMNVDGPLNFAEWYFPARLPADLSACGGARVPEDGWQAAEGLRCFDGGSIDAPLLTVTTELADPERVRTIAERLAPMIGDGRPHAGASRDEAEGWTQLDVPAMTHVDPLSAPEGAGNPVPEAVLDFLRTHSAEGSVEVTPPP